VDNAIHRINHHPVDSMVCFCNTYCIYWIAIYPMVSVMQPLNNWGQNLNFPRVVRHYILYFPHTCTFTVIFAMFVPQIRRQIRNCKKVYYLKPLNGYIQCSSDMNKPKYTRNLSLSKFSVCKRNNTLANTYE